jgi:hypothetical protein
MVFRMLDQLLRKASERLHYERTSDHRNRLTVMIAAQP